MPQRRKTPQREVIEKVLDETDKPLLPNDILDLARITLPSIGIATVFRALKDLVEEGTVNPVYIGDESPRYERSRGHHHHFKCNDCGEVYDLYNCPGNLNKLIPSGFELLDHEITLFGRCSNCKIN